MVMSQTKAVAGSVKVEYATRKKIQQITINYTSVAKMFSSRQLTSIEMYSVPSESVIRQNYSTGIARCTLLN